MPLDLLTSTFATAGLCLAGALATFYAFNSQENRPRNAIFSIVLVSLAVYRVMGS